jgi:hypothetical protein
MTPATCERTLVVLLRVTAAVMISAIVPAVMPLSWMDATHRWLGMGPLPRGPVVEYLARTLSAFYAFHGALLWIFAGDVGRYRPALRFMFGAALVFGAGVLLVDARAGLPLRWILAEGPFVMALSAAALRLLSRLPAEKADDQAPRSR